ncbi:MAG: hypothetical protein M1831_006927 [Alyxoria varia]|nr:MAG: hypothetical protein M1831_006927 [Alyxoria varia]
MAVTDDRGQYVWHVTIAMTVVPTLSVLLRFWSRLISPSPKFWWDDYTAFFAFILSITTCIIRFYEVDFGLGRHVQKVDSQADLQRVLKILYVAPMLFDICVTVCKCSALLFYRRVFPTSSRKFRLAWWITLAVVIAWLLFRLPADIWACVPPRKFWVQSAPGHCTNNISSFTIYIVAAVLDVFTDLMILMLPVPLLWNLRTRRSRKVMVIAAFVCGYARLGAFINHSKGGVDLQKDVTWMLVTLDIWAETELAIAVFSICIPSWFYLVNRVHNHGFASLFTTKSDVEFKVRAPRYAINSNAREESFQRLRGAQSSNGVHNNGSSYDHCKSNAFADSGSAESGLASEQYQQQLPEEIALGRIGVRKDVHVHNDHAAT